MSPASHAIALDLESAGAELVKRLGGTWTPRGGLCLCPAHADRRPSLSVRVGTSSLLFKCFAGCDTIAVLRAIRRLKFEVPVVADRDARPWQARDAAIAWRVADLWDEAWPLAGSPAATYAAARGLIGPADCLRYHPRTPLGAGRSVRFRPALLAAVRAGGGVIAVERLFLDLPAAHVARDLDPSKRLLGRPRDGAVRFGSPVKTLGLAEGWETAWSAHIILGIPVWATLGSERFPHITIPDAVDRLVLLPDNDDAGTSGANKAMAAHAAPGRTIGILPVRDGFNDWNDLLRGGGEEGGKWVRNAA